jgi:ABC-2 type transport system ATP-binding protein
MSFVAASRRSESDGQEEQSVGELTSVRERAPMDREAAAAVEAEGLAKTYRSRAGTVKAVRGVDLRVEAGEVFGFLGPNGAGKSTTVKMLTTLLSLSSGSARVAGLDVAREPDAVRRRIGVALQEAGLDPRQTGRELLVLQGRLFDLSAREAAERTVQLLELVELTDAADRPIKGYSGGMKRRLDLASALVHEPEVLFLDEPTTGLDPASRLTVWDEVRRINERGTTVFLTTQYLEEADQLCDRLAIIDDGRIVREGTPAQLKAELRERLGLAREASLDDVFLDATGRTRTHVAGEVQEVST